MDARALFLGIAFAVMWSSAFTSAKIVVAHAPPLTALAFRFAISGLIAVVIARALGQTWRLTPPQWRATVVFGLCQNALYLGLNFIAMRTIDAGLASIIASTMPLLVALVGWLVFRERLPAMGVTGLLAGLAGVALIMGSRISGGVDMGGLALCIVAVVALTVATLSVRGASSGGNLLMVVGLQMLVGSAILTVAALLFEEWQVDWTPSLILAFAYTTLVPGLAATLTWFVLVGRIGATRAASFHFLNPFLGVALAALVLGEQLGPLDLAGVAIIMAGILAVQLTKAPAPSAPRRTSA
ncbi:Threonine/homoserine efflux transporter RhtA [Palleronia marisminoris]|uniref:Putative inner membrane transporter yiJE n=1 Tax=Palleronia marisminoris TaxID=315423 RepID=A0A1Y5TM07_9RHOB|nr:DMT family transporter [Palleronia marisminoris]SFH44038.1 Threonine/homoserine efflux transporter RhtA [Palleronia marisminoris]SLN67185.1 putative inner membrane transporter yiJE [Palleronia marisminoris]